MKVVSRQCSVVSLALYVTLFALSVSAEAQQPAKVPTVGVLRFDAQPSPNVEALRQGLRDLGYEEGKSIAIEYRFAEGKRDRLPGFVAEMIRLKVDLIVSNSTETVLMVRDANKLMPVVMPQISDPLGSGLVASLARPGGSITGFSLVSTDLAGKDLELMKEVLPRLSRVALLVLRDHPPTRLLVAEMESAARVLKLTVQPFEIAIPAEFESAFAAFARARAGALFVQNNTVFGPNGRAISELAAKRRLPTMGGTPEFTETGGLMGYGPNSRDMWRRAATYVDKILKGAKPADLPVEQPTKFELIINLKTAKQIGVTIPPNVLARADRVIR
jgi:putative ABC transport system substrate-binding protein